MPSEPGRASILFVRRSRTASSSKNFRSTEIGVNAGPGFPVIRVPNPASRMPKPLNPFDAHSRHYQHPSVRANRDRILRVAHRAYLSIHPTQQYRIAQGACRLRVQVAARDTT
jgi:hypothetical protein